MISEDLARSALEGDGTAFEALYEDCVHIVFGIALKILGTRSAAEDVTQMVFVSILTSRVAFKKGNFNGWIARVARNCAIDEWRRSKRNMHLFDYGSEDKRAPVDEEVIHRLEVERAREVIASLPAGQRSAIEMALFNGLSHQEISERTGLPLGTVKARIRSGLKKIRAAIGERIAS